MTLRQFRFAREFIAEEILSEVLSYAGKDPERNLPRLMNLAGKMAIMSAHKQQVSDLRRNLEENPAIRDYVHRLATQVDPNVQRHLLFNFFINAVLAGIPKQRKAATELGVDVPWAVLIDPTSACNLRCKGCWAGKYTKHDTLSLETVDRVITEAKELGVYFIVMSGGEPTLWPHLFELAHRHKDAVFMLYTNGTLIDGEFADKIVDAANISPAISLEGGREETDWRRGEGTFDKIMTAMDNLRERGAIFGCSLTVTRKNAYKVFSDEFIDMLLEKGVMYGWSFHYVPIGRDPDLDLMVTPEQRAWLADRVLEVRNKKGFPIADFWNDGQLTNGCIAGGRRYFHINARGDVEPCAFIHFAVDNIKNKSVKEVLKSSLFRAYQKRQPFHENLLRPCPFIDVPQALRDIVAESNASPTHPEAEAVLHGEIAQGLDRKAAQWGEEADKIWAKRVGESIKTKQEAAVS